MYLVSPGMAGQRAGGVLDVGHVAGRVPEARDVHDLLFDLLAVAHRLEGHYYARFTVSHSDQVLRRQVGHELPGGAPQDQVTGRAFHGLEDQHDRHRRLFLRGWPPSCRWAGLPPAACRPGHPGRRCWCPRTRPDPPPGPSWPWPGPPCAGSPVRRRSRRQGPRTATGPRPSTVTGTCDGVTTVVSIPAASSALGDVGARPAVPATTRTCCAPRTWKSASPTSLPGTVSRAGEISTFT